MINKNGDIYAMGKMSPQHILCHACVYLVFYEDAFSSFC